MPTLSNIFGGDDSSSDSQDSGNLMSDIDAIASINGSHESYSQSTDEDGNSETNADSTDFGTDVDVGSLLDGATDSMSSFDSDDSGN
jgi:hypothetical protein